MNFKLENSGNLTQEFLKREILDFHEAMEFVKNLPYARNSNRADFQLVLTEEKGTCSSKHALLKELAEENELEDVQLMLGIFEMRGENYPKIQARLLDNQLEYIPEAHTYLRIKREIWDLTSPTSNSEHFAPYLLDEMEIRAEDVVQHKIEIHQHFLKKWCAEHSFHFEVIWGVREGCIRDLSST